MRGRAAVALVLALVGCTAGAPQRGGVAVAYIPSADAPRIAIVDVVDGDTIKLTNRGGVVANVRLLGFDTPETYQAQCAAEKAWGDRATETLDRTLRAARQIDVLTIDGPDKYRRLLLSLAVDGRPLADIMVASGLAVRYGGERRRDWCALGLPA